MPNADRRDESEGPIEGTPHLDLSEDVFSDSASAPLAPELDAPKPGLDAPPAGDDAVDRESAPVGDEIDPAAADESAVPVEPVSDEH